MYVDGSATSNQSAPMASARSGSQQGTPSRQTTASTLMDLKEGKHNPLLAFCPSDSHYKCKDNPVCSTD